MDPPDSGLCSLHCAFRIRVQPVSCICLIPKSFKQMKMAVVSGCGFWESTGGCAVPVCQPNPSLLPWASRVSQVRVTLNFVKKMSHSFCYAYLIVVVNTHVGAPRARERTHPSVRKWPSIFVPCAPLNGQAGYKNPSMRCGFGRWENWLLLRNCRLRDGTVKELEEHSQVQYEELPRPNQGESLDFGWLLFLNNI